MTMEIHNRENCPCPADCIRHGECEKCIPFHQNRNEQTYCEYLKEKSEKKSYTPEEAIASGKELRLLDYGPCAG